MLLPMNENLKKYKGKTGVNQKCFTGNQGMNVVVLASTNLNHLLNARHINLSF